MVLVKTKEIKRCEKCGNGIIPFMLSGFNYSPRISECIYKCQRENCGAVYLVKAALYDTSIAKRSRLPKDKQENYYN